MLWNNSRYAASNIAEIVEIEGKLDETIEERIEHKADIWTAYWWDLFDSIVLITLLS